MLHSLFPHLHFFPGPVTNPQPTKMVCKAVALSPFAFAPQPCTIIAYCQIGYATAQMTVTMVMMKQIVV